MFRWHFFDLFSFLLRENLILKQRLWWVAATKLSRIVYNFGLGCFTEIFRKSCIWSWLYKYAWDWICMFLKCHRKYEVNLRGNQDFENGLAFSWNWRTFIRNVKMEKKVLTKASWKILVQGYSWDDNFWKLCFYIIIVKNIHRNIRKVSHCWPNICKKKVKRFFSLFFLDLNLGSVSNFVEFKLQIHNLFTLFLCLQCSRDSKQLVRI